MSSMVLYKMGSWDDMRLYTLDSWEYLETPDESMWMKPNGTIHSSKPTSWVYNLTTYFMNVLLLLGL